MTRTLTTVSRSLIFSLAAALLLTLPQPVQAAQDAAPIEAVKRDDAAKASDEAQKKPVMPTKAEPGAKRDETHTTKDPLVSDAPDAKGADAKALSASEKSEAIADADAITTFEASRVIGQAKPWQMTYQPASSPMMHTIKNLQDMVLVIITVIVIFVMALMVYIMIRFSKRNNPVPQTFTHNKTIEIIWTVIPILILVAIGIPSIRAHYKVYFSETALNSPDLTLKVVGHQWYWSYEYPAQGIAFDSNIKAEKELINGEPRLLAVDNPIVVPVNKVVKIQMTAADVIHDWAVPAFGVKKDAVPGRLNETWFKAEKEGIYFGQCSELCGKSHGFMPIMIYVVSDEEFEIWTKGAKLKFAANDMMQFAALKNGGQYSVFGIQL